jgi:hypothetical protein
MPKHKIKTTDLVIVWGTIFLVIAVLAIPDFYKTLMEGILTVAFLIYGAVNVWGLPISQQKRVEAYNEQKAKGKYPRYVSVRWFWFRIIMEFLNMIAFAYYGINNWNFMSIQNVMVITYDDLLSILFFSLSIVFAWQGIGHLWKHFTRAYS